MVRPRFLTQERVLEIHTRTLEKFGGASGHDEGRLDSALNAPKAGTSAGHLLPFPFGMAAAYLHSLAMDHPFVDGNKRTAAYAMLAFLNLNNISVRIPQDELYDLVIGVAQGRVSREEVQVFLEGHAVT